MALVRSGNSFSTTSPNVPEARRPASPEAVLIGIRVRIDSRTSNSAGSLIIGSWRGKKPRVVLTMNAGRVVSSGLVSVRTGKERDEEVGPREPMLTKLY